jgi:hypothetical protein
VFRRTERLLFVGHEEAEMAEKAKRRGFWAQIVDFLVSSPSEVTVVVGPFGEPYVVALVDDIAGVPSVLRRGQP